MSTEMLEKVALPFTAAATRVPLSVPPFGLAPKPSVTLPVYDATSWFCASRACTTTVVGAPAVSCVGTVVNASVVAMLVPEVAVAEIVSAFRFPDVADSVWAPVDGPSVHVVENCPTAFVAPLVGATEPPPVATATATVCPDTAFPKASVRPTTIC